MTLSYGPFISRKQAQAQGLKHYFTGKPCKSDHVCARHVAGYICMECNKERQQNQRDTRGMILNQQRKDREISSVEKLEKRRQKNRNSYRRLVATKAGRGRHRAAVRLAAAKYRQTEKALQARSNWRKTSPTYKVIRNVRTRLRELIKNRSIQTSELTGCTGKELVGYLEAQFKPGMTWDNYGIDGWHIDHIRPCASFDLTDPEQQKQCFHYTNLQPLWAADNLAKSDKWEAA
jgi:hypothetical protein